MTCAFSKIHKNLRFLCVKRKLDIFRLNNLHDESKKMTSALFIPGNKATETYSYFTPYLDFDTKFDKIAEFQEDFNKRGYSINLEYLKDAWEMYKILCEKKNIIQMNINDLIKGKNNSTNSTNEETENESKPSSIQYTVLKKELHTLKDAIWKLEEDVIIRCLKMPNKLHERTPVNTYTVLETFGDPPISTAKINHIDIGNNLKILDYKNKFHYFLFGKAALFEHSVLNFAGHVLKKEKFTRLASFDFSRSNIVEGSGLDHTDINSSLLLDINNEKKSLNPLHLVGQSSLVSFLALKTKLKFNIQDYPIYYFSTGRQYTPKPNNDVSEGLFQVCQESVVNVFGITINDVECETVFDSIINVAKQFYNDLCDHYRIVMRSAKELNPSETLRVSFELWSNYKHQYVEVGHISMHSDYLSKRLLILHKSPTKHEFPCIVSGTLLSVPKFLACLIEKNPNDFEIIESVRPYLCR